MRPPSIDRRLFLRGTAAAGLGGVARTSPNLLAAPNSSASVTQVLSTPHRIWDLHCHFSGVSGRTGRERVEQLLAYADRMGIERLVFFMGFPWSRNPDPDEFRRQNDQVLDVVTKWSNRLFGFAYVNAHHPDESVQEIERCVRDGPLVGIKLWMARRCNEPAIDPIIHRCAELRAAIYQHTWLKTQGNDPGESTPSDLAELAKRHPTVPMICGHTGGDWPRGIRAVRPYPNVSIGIGGSEPTAGFVEMAVRELGADRVIYGSDIGGRSFASQLAKVVGADVSESSKRSILGGNLQQMLQPILRAKGIEK